MAKTIKKPTTKPAPRPETSPRVVPHRRTQSEPSPKGDPSRGGGRPPKKD